jgi:hypothetical protein
MFLELVDIVFLYNTTEFENQTYTNNKVIWTEVTSHNPTCHIQFNFSQLSSRALLFRVFE